MPPQASQDQALISQDLLYFILSLLKMKDILIKLRLEFKLNKPP